MSDLHTKYNLEKKINIDIKKSTQEIEILSKKIEAYQGFNPDIINEYTLKINDIERQITQQNSLLYHKTQNFDDYKANKEVRNKLLNEIKNLQDDLYFTDEFLKILDPVKGYPKTLLDTNLVTLNKHVNDFISFAGT